MFGGACCLVIGIGLVWTRATLGLALIVVGAGLLGLGLWMIVSPSSRRNIYRRSMRETTATSKGAFVDERTDEYGRVHFSYYVTLWFEAETDRGSVRYMALRPRVNKRIWSSMAGADRQVRVRYAAEDPTIALIEGEW
jgi:hypothetical protein